MKKIIVVGNSVSASLMGEYLKLDLRYSIEAYAVDKKFIQDRELDGCPVVDLETIYQTYPASEYSALIAVGYGNLNRNREGLYNRLKEMGYTIETYIHPDARVYTNRIGEGSLVMPNAFIDVFVEIGSNSVIWGNCSVAHDTTIGNNCWLATGCVVSANSYVGNNTFIGVGATIVNGLQIGQFNVIGAGASIFKNTNDYDVYITRQTEKFRLRAEDYLRFAKL